MSGLAGLRRIGTGLGSRGFKDHSYLPLRTKAEWIDRFNVFFPGVGATDDYMENLFRLNFPLELSPEAYFKLCWRIKKFQLEGDVVKDSDSLHFSASVEMVRLPVEDDPTITEDSTMFKTIAAESEIDIIGASKRFYFQDELAPPLPPGHPPSLDAFQKSLRNEGFFMRDPAVPGGVDFPFFIRFGTFPFNPQIGFSLLGDGLSGVNAVEFVGSVYDPDTQKVFAQLFLGCIVDSNFTCLQTSREWVVGSGVDYPRFPFNAIGLHDLPSLVGELTISGLETDPVIVSIYRQQSSGDPDFASMHATLDPTEYWEYRNSEGLPVYDHITGDQLLDPLS